MNPVLLQILLDAVRNAPALIKDVQSIIHTHATPEQKAFADQVFAKDPESYFGPRPATPQPEEPEQPTSVYYQMSWTKPARVLATDQIIKGNDRGRDVWMLIPHGQTIPGGWEEDKT